MVARRRSVSTGPLRAPCAAITSLIETVFLPPVTAAPGSGVATVVDENWPWSSNTVRSGWRQAEQAHA
jgi:hypothetical protein